MLTSQRNRPAALVVAGLAVGGMVFTKLPLLVVLLGLAPLSIADILGEIPLNADSA